MKKTWAVSAVCLFVVLLLLTGCGGTGEQVISTQPSAQNTATGTPRTVPEMLLSTYNEGAATSSNGAAIDVSNAAEGYVGASAVNENHLKFQVVCGEVKYNYDLPNDGTPLIVPLQSGSGSYKLRVMQNTVEDKYIEIAAVTQQVQLTNDLLPFLYSTSMVSFSPDSLAAKTAEKVCAGAQTEVDAASAVYAYVRDNVSYDYAFAESNPAAYVSSPDATLQSGKGICFDYATLAAAMLRSQGIPCKLITGYVGADSLYHAWNMFYTEESGWVTVSISVSANTWQRIDITFASTGGEDPKATYTDRYVY